MAYKGTSTRIGAIEGEGQLGEENEERTRHAFLDFLLCTLVEHQKNLDDLIGRLQEIVESLPNQHTTVMSKKICEEERTPRGGPVEDSGLFESENKPI